VARHLLYRALLWTVLGPTAAVTAQTLEDELQRTPTAELAGLAGREGDAIRGAVVFFQHQMACSKCHSTGDAKPSTLGPDLTTLGKDVGDQMLVEAVLQPSKVIRQGFESVTVVTTAGRTLVGLLVERTNDSLMIRDISRDGELKMLPAAEIEDVTLNTVSIMPAAQVNQLASRQQFLDLVRYLIEIRDGGAQRARELKPSPALLTFSLPEYEQHLDHAALIGDWSEASFKRGEAIYQRVCANCHGTRERPGSLPTSLRFAEGKFKNGSDPLAMYQTLTRGFGLMAAQTWMVPSQKYDVIHYIRETYLRQHSPTQFVTVGPAYLARLPKGDTRGPEPSQIEPWSAMDYGPSLTNTYEVPGRSHNLAYKGIAVRLDPGAGGVSRGRHWMLFDTDTLRVAAAWSAPERGDLGGNFIDWRGIQFNGEHQIHPRVVGRIALANSTGPGWANPVTAGFRDDQRVEGRDGRRYGPLPRNWAKFRGLYHYGQQVVVSYSVGATDVLELPRLLTRDDVPEIPLFLRTLNVGPRDRELVMQVAENTAAGARTVAVEGTIGSVVKFPSADASPDSRNSEPIVAGFVPQNIPAVWSATGGQLQLTIPAGKEPLKFTVWTAAVPCEKKDQAEKLIADLSDPVIPDPDLALTSFTSGGPPRWPQKLETRPAIGSDDGPFAVDVLTAPESNPWLAQVRFTGLDFLPDGRIAVCSWDGDVWLVEISPPPSIGNEPAPAPVLRWQRIASGLFQPLGLKITSGKIHVICRDQLTVLHDLNGDGEIDFYECLNNDHQVTEHFHEFAMGLQTDADGNFYYAKSGRHALPAVVPHHGTLLRISRDGSRTDILATGFRAANGVCLNPDGSFMVTDQEGFWNPKNRINWVTLNPTGKPRFYGNMFGYHDVTDSSDAAMEPPLCWITNAFDRSPAELVWVDSDRWGPLHGSLLNLSYGYGKVYVVPHEKVHGVMQGGMIELPIPAFPTGVMRGRFNPRDSQLYLCGMFAWAGSATYPGGLYRLRATGRPMHLPIALHARKACLEITFTEPLDPAAVDVQNVHIKTWSLKRTENYGSDHYKERPLCIRGAASSTDGKTLSLKVPDLRPTWCMEIKYALRSADGKPVAGIIHNTIHEPGD
jgi:putative heme-binding domain-containing protein